MTQAKTQTVSGLKVPITETAFLNIIKDSAFNFILTDADNSLDEQEFTDLDKVDKWTWEEGPDVRPLQSRTVVQQVIEQAKGGDTSQFHKHFLKDFVVPDNYDDVEASE